MNCEEAELETDADTVDMAQKIKDASLRTQLLDLNQIQEEKYTSAQQPNLLHKSRVTKLFIEQQLTQRCHTREFIR